VQHPTPGKSGGWLGFISTTVLKEEDRKFAHIESESRSCAYDVAIESSAVERRPRLKAKAKAKGD
jgi:hypothetical protein